ncbi:hypothetical protein R0K18_15290 [Pantoea sp. SIMBA_133]
MLLKIIKPLRKFIAKLSGALILVVMVVGISLMAILNKGAMRIIGPAYSIIVALIVYALMCLITENANPG